MKRLLCLALACGLTACSGDDPASAHDDADSAAYHATVAAGDGTLDYAVLPCAGAAARAGGAGQALELRPDGGDLWVQLLVETFCSASTDGALQVRPGVDGDQVHLGIVFAGTPVRCTCAVPVHGVVRGLAPGRYTVSATYQVESEDGASWEPEVLGQGQVDVGPVPEAPATMPPAPLRLSAADDGTTVATTAGRQVDVTNADLVGAPTTQHLEFNLRAPGSVVLRLVYARPWEPAAPAAGFAVTLMVAAAPGALPAEDGPQR